MAFTAAAAGVRPLVRVDLAVGILFVTRLSCLEGSGLLQPEITDKSKNKYSRPMRFIEYPRPRYLAALTFLAQQIKNTTGMLSLFDVLFSVSIQNDTDILYIFTSGLTRKCDRWLSVIGYQLIVDCR